MSAGSCPSCGAPLEIKTRAAALIICAFCNSTIARTEQKLEDLGKMALLQEDGSPLQLGARGTFRSVAFEVIGRIQVEYPAGFWNEWYLQFADNRTGWLGEGQGQYAVFFLVAKPGEVPPHDKLKLGMSVRLGVERYTVKEIAKARVIAGAGELPFSVNQGYGAPVADLEGHGTHFATIDYSETPPLVFAGDRVEFDDLALTGLREFEGW